MALTTNEEQELKYLDVFISNKITKFSSMAFPSVVTAAMGSGADTIVRNFMRDGVVVDLYTGEYEFTAVGHNRYKILKNRKTNDRIVNWAFWVIFVCTLIAAGDVIVKWAKESPSKRESTKSASPATPQKANSPAQTAIPDSTKGHRIDSLKKKSE